MTCIVGLVDSGKVYIGGDSLGSNSFDGDIRKDAKVFRNGKFVMGFTTSYRMGQLLNYTFSSSRNLNEDEDEMSYMVNVFINDVRCCLKNGGFATSENSQEIGGVFLVGFNGRLFTVHSDYQVSENIDEFTACGCGGDYARGAMLVSRHLPPDERIMQALAVAEHFSIGVKSPFTIIS